MMTLKKSTYLLVLAILWTNACQPSINSATAYSVAGSYQLIDYNTATLSDDNPSGTVIATQLDEQHVQLLVKGTSGKVKINFSYSSVLVLPADLPASNQPSFTLLYKGHAIGEAGTDGVSRYLNLTPSATVGISALEF